MPKSARREHIEKYYAFRASNYDAAIDAMSPADFEHIKLAMAILSKSPETAQEFMWRLQENLNARVSAKRDHEIEFFKSLNS